MYQVTKKGTPVLQVIRQWPFMVEERCGDQLASDFDASLSG